MKHSLVLPLALLFPLVASAHGFDAEVKLVAGFVHVSAYFEDNTPAGEAKVTVLDEQKNTIREGKTDKDGKWSFPAPESGRYRVVVDAGAGHLARRTLTIPGAEQEVQAVSDGPSREEFTGTGKYLRAGMGLALLAGIAAVYFYFIRTKPTRLS